MPARGELVIGVDFDNTLIVYGELFRRLAEEHGLIASSATSSKHEVREAVRQLPDGDTQWQKLQAAAYGPRIGEARWAEGAEEFLARCSQASIPVYVVSHKTELAGYDETNTNLRQAAMEWMAAAGMFRTGGLKRDAVYFNATRHEKIDRIRSLGCTHFVDDLEEVFLEPTFPAEVEKILYQPHAAGNSLPGLRVADSWNQIGEWLLGG
jgi:hypothetical protein